GAATTAEPAWSRGCGKRLAPASRTAAGAGCAGGGGRRTAGRAAAGRRRGARAGSATARGRARRRRSVERGGTHAAPLAARPLLSQRRISSVFCRRIYRLTRLALVSMPTRAQNRGTTQQAKAMLAHISARV